MTKYAQVTEYGIVQLSGLTPLQRRMTPAGLRKSGIYVYEDNPPSCDERYYHLGSSVEFDGTTVTKTYTIFPIDLETFKERAKVDMATARWYEMSEPTKVSGYDALWFADKEAMNDMLRASSDLQTAIQLGHLPEDTTLQWKTADGSFVTVSLNDLVTVRLLLSQRQQVLYAKEALLAAAIDTCETPQEVEAIKWSMQASS